MNNLNKFQSEQFDCGLNKASFLQLPAVISFFILICFFVKAQGQGSVLSTLSWSTVSVLRYRIVLFNVNV